LKFVAGVKSSIRICNASSGQANNAVTLPIDKRLYLCSHL